MCWSKAAETPSAPTTKMAPKTMIGVDCPSAANKCDDADHDFCLNGGRCCITTTGDKKFCVCLENYTGTRCHRANIQASRDEMQRAGFIAAVGGFLGLVVIILFVTVIFLQIKYYRHRKKRTLNELEADRMSKPDIDRKDSGSRRILRNRPGYSWRESVRRTTSSYQKLQTHLWRSVPEDLFKMGMTLALFGVQGGGEAKNDNAPGRCFSAYAGSGGGAGGERGERGEGRKGVEAGEGRVGVRENKTDRYTGIQETEENGNKEKMVFKTEALA